MFRDEDEKIIVCTTLKVFFPPSISKRGDKIQQFILEKQMLPLSRARTRLHQSGDCKQQHEAYTNSHTHLHTNPVLVSPPQEFAATFCVINYLLAFLEKVSVQPVGLLYQIQFCEL